MINTIRKFFVFILFFIFINQIASADQIQQIIRHQMPTATIGIVVLDNKTGRLLYQRNGFHYFTPASNVKLFTAAAGLFKLGPNFHYYTLIAYNSKQLQSGVLNGNLYVIFNGDPSLQAQDLQSLLQQVSRKGIRRITGNVIIDDSHFQKPYYAPGWSQDDLPWYFAAPVSAVILNENAFVARLTVTRNQANWATVRGSNGSQYLNVTGRVQLVSHAYAKKHCSLLIENERNRIYLSGCWPRFPRGQAADLKLAVPKPELYAIRVVAATLKQNGIAVRGQITTGKTPPQQTILASHASQPLSILMQHMLKKSDNLYAESLLKTLAYQSDKSGTFQEGANVVKAVLQQHTNIDFNKTRLVDGSGESNYDLVTPYQIAQLLYTMRHVPKLNKIYDAALAISGKDGTLKYRLNTAGLARHIHAKTGTLTGVANLSGYLLEGRNHTLIFSILINHNVKKARAAYRLQNSIISNLTKNYV